MGENRRLLRFLCRLDIIVGGFQVPVTYTYFAIIGYIYIYIRRDLYWKFYLSVALLSLF